MDVVAFVALHEVQRHPRKLLVANRKRGDEAVAVPTVHSGPVEDQVAEAVKDRATAMDFDAVDTVWSVTGDNVGSGVIRGVCDGALVLANVVTGDAPMQRHHKYVNLETQAPHVLEESV